MFVDIYNTDKKYNIIYADPPWSYYNDMSVNVDCTTVRGMRRPPYPVLSSKDIMKFPVQEIAEDNAILFIWTTDYHLRKCMDVIEAWGFTYKTIGFVWAKKNKHFRASCPIVRELCNDYGRLYTFCRGKRIVQESKDVRIYYGKRIIY